MSAAAYEITSPFPEEHLPLMWGWLAEFHDQMVDDSSPKTFAEMVEKNKRDLAAGAKVYAVLGQDRVPVGVVCAEHIGDQMYLGHLVFDRYTLSGIEKMAATRIALRRMFAAGARKVIWQVFDDNRAFLIFLRRLGADIEGHLRDGARRDGKLVDIVLMASFQGDK